MPKASQGSIQRSASSSDPLANPTHPNVLKRNQVFSQCRRRKLVCDAKRPCSTCVRSHAHQLNHAPPGANIAAKPECTFDEVAETNIMPSEGPKSKYERLENRINELETLLRQKENKDQATLNVTPSDDIQSIQSSGSLVATGGVSQKQLNTYPSNGSPSTRSLTRSPPHETFTSVQSSDNSLSTASIAYGLDVMWPNWPSNLPGPELLRHLVDVFFTFHPHANRLFHASTFISSLSYGPSHPKFPCTAVLHAICAVGSLYTAAVTSPPLPDFDKIAPDEIFLEKHRLKEPRLDSFAEQQAKYARETGERLNTLGENLFQVFQSTIVLTWFYWSHGRWVDVFMTSAYCVRLSIPLGLNMCPPFHSIAKSDRPPSIIAPARTVIEDETRRNAFWLAYAMERQHGMGNGWALCLDDQDISQLLPVRGDQFEQGTLVTPLERQWAHAGDLLLTHPESQIDSFILYIKGTILIARVKVFNTRFRARHYAGDTAVTNIRGDNISERYDPRGSSAFIELDHVASSFRSSFPSHLRNPISNNVVDNHLYTASLMPHVATIVLHDPHAEVRQSGCISALKILTAARAILDMIYNVWSTSYDITLLDSFCSLAWFTAGRVLVRFLQAAIDAEGQDQIATLRAELEFVHSAIVKLGQRIPLAYRFSKMLEDLVTKRCGESYSSSLRAVFSRSADPASLQSLPQGYTYNDLTGQIGFQENLHDTESFLSME
ncbi:hypothetical protein AGABI1DRAFT_66768 [Agaricus bisporus var. burnettii JB137-S8]|uniref:Xylanolytic transcriptional activator regulatory domain-containing protein n=1 Tax=Agaricus bisporus var. burnettii (strain JB137-S8 / ATCC MYA-4627 / FGSC 10392) TaxID=597362 RepID=K5XJU1_AGABU|nr:uncharacterized protein AGABI1DRAFT_66768 [Agaricus bisporus var. burnettii JB137-S8]EKM83798.1 hypothetical protein AGABI1DRAFT_66768 [Agaricus bisporus var. burnettii JB137-S8]